MLVEPFTALENVVLGAEGGFRLEAGMRRARARLEQLARDYHLEIDPHARVTNLGVGERQRVEILKALYRGADVLILDEPTAVLTPQEADHLFHVLQSLRDEGKTVVLITHKLREIRDVTDVVTVMRHGRVVATRPTDETTAEQLAELMVGRRVSLRADKSPCRPGEPVLEVSDLVVEDALGVPRVKGVGFTVRRGEIVGVAGVAGNGQSELLEALAGIRPVKSGRVRWKDRDLTDVETRSPQGMRRLGLSHVPEDRQRMGLIMPFAAQESAILGYHDEATYNGAIRLRRAAVASSFRRQSEAYDIRPRNGTRPTSAFSGGNQQKIVLARELDRHPDLLLVGQPTRGVDIGAIEFIQATIDPRVRGGQHRVLIQSVDAAAVNLPWELVEVSDGLPLGCDAAWSLRRTSLPTLSTGGPLDPGPLRIVFLASAPLDLPQLDFEREEDAMLRATSRLGEDVVVYISDTGTFDELGDLVARIRPHIVHLSGHGSVDASGHGSFAFEDERGHMDARDAADLATQIFRGSSVRCVMLNACETSRAATSGLCQTLTASGVPHAIGWAAPVVDDRATEFTEALYRRLAHGEPLSQAVAHARDTVRRSGVRRDGGVEVQDATFALAQVYCSDDGTELYDRAAPRRPWQGPRIVHELLGDGIKGLREGFVGRRRDVQRLVPPLRDGGITFAVITGIGGAGKSTLATRAANRLAAAGFEVRPIRAAEGPSAPERARLTLSKVISSLSDAFLKAGREDLHRLLTSGEIVLHQRLRLAVDGLNEHRLLLVLDNFEDCLDLDSRQILDPDLAECYRLLATRLTRGSRVIVTCRYFPEDTPTDQPQVKHVPLHDLDEPATLKFLRRDHVVESRLAKGELGWQLIRDLHRVLGGTPGFLVEVRRILESADADDLMAELHGDSAGPIASSRDEYFHRIVLPRLWNARSPGARDLASRLALSELPLPADTVAAFTDEHAAARLECSRYGIVSELPETNLPTLYAVPGLLRPWMIAPERLDAEAARATHRHLANFWKVCLESDRAREFRVSVDTELSACREHSRLGGDAETFRWATVRLAHAFRRRAEWRLAYTLLQEIADSDRDAPTLVALGSLELLLADYIAARTNLERALTLTQAVCDRAGEAATLHSLASLDITEGHYDLARTTSDKARTIKQAIGDRPGEAASWHQLATIDLNEGHHHAARANFERALAMLNAVGDRAGEAATWHNLATIELKEGDYPAARAHVKASLAINQGIGDRAGVASAWHQLAMIDIYERDYAAARANFDHALALRQAIGDLPGEATTRHSLAWIDLKESAPPAARANLERILTLRQALGDLAGEATAWHQLATIDVKEGRYPAARGAFEKSLALKRAGGDRAGEANAWLQLGMIDFHERHYPAARANFEHSLSTNQAIGHRAGEADAWYQIAIVDVLEDHEELDRVNFERVLAIRQAIGDRDGEAAAFFHLGMLADRQGRTEAGIRLVATSWLINDELGNNYAESDLRCLAGLCHKAAVDDPRRKSILAEVAETYEADRGRSMIERAFNPD